MATKNFPTVSILIPTLNAKDVLKSCLASIAMQNYPKDKIEIIISDGGSTDGTVELAKEYGAKVVSNKLKTAEAGKMVALNAAKGDYIALIDSDNILPTTSWLKEMIVPLQEHTQAVGGEPWKYTWRKQDGFITRYCALIGMNDPFVHFLGNYDRVNLLTGKWTQVLCKERDFGKYILAEFTKNEGIPTIGANGTVFKADFLKQNARGEYLFDIDILHEALSSRGKLEFIKVKNGIIHTFCESNVSKFARKQRRRVKDFLYHKSVDERSYDWDSVGKNKTSVGFLKFFVSCITVFPLVYQSFQGYRKKRDIAWFFHPLACEITLWEYGWGFVLSLFKQEQISRDRWGQ